ncbi:phospholipase, patatin family protein [Trichodelitschia bisporula]|uniref:Phospholipase, patatin family protein n=1 Tax=Trichodelitschia bisporula TaxID=703511 RepID=A0A6G1HIA5_9PEZI|nr:phospholipase, patatin family protein [Trichodelitschia bisporula]
MRVSKNGEPTIRKILSLDGGGVRGLSTIIILEHIMRMLGKQRGAVLEPWQEFDMIAGTSTGGLIAIMLGRLRMSLAECKKAYLNLSKAIFTPVRNKANVPGKVLDFLNANGKFDSQPLEHCIREILKEQNKPENELLKEDDPDACKVFVCAVEGKNDAAVLIRSYESMEYDGLYDICQIWEAARATSAASTIFEPIEIGPYRQKFVDGALRLNNPIDRVDDESRDLWPGQDRMIISIGTGAAPGQDVTGNLFDLARALKRIVTDTEERNDNFRRKHPEMIQNGRLFRFNVQHGLASVGLEEYQHVDSIAGHTGKYLTQFDTRLDVERCTAALKNGGQRLNYIAGAGTN